MQLMAWQFLIVGLNLNATHVDTVKEYEVWLDNLVHQ